MNTFEIDLMPGFISIIDLDMKYVAINKNLADLFNLEQESISGMSFGTKCSIQREIINSLVDSPVGTNITWECYYNSTFLFVCSLRQENFIISQGIDITNQKLLEEDLIRKNERNTTLLKSIPEAIGFAETRRSAEQLKLLVNALLENPIVDQRGSIESLVTLEVELREATLKVREIERILYIDNNSLLSRLKSIEVIQTADNEKWKEVNNIKELSNDLSKLVNFFTGIPGGIKTWLIIFVVIQLLGIFAIDIGIRVFNLEQVIPIDRKR
ncbi:hypothetical protein [Anabaena azotica]|uniref:PAS domain-containing protein n=1 Tax=Anabaena azotica FACHB-119 TaxID=947527 RepID=A0ABR8CY76_9NOST|nr:hypothetical protein [Anabaena azotica]MBD2499885.1 hypothetical protein [Anabaena azotica FACHB-119]